MTPIVFVETDILSIGGGIAGLMAKPRGGELRTKENTALQRLRAVLPCGRAIRLRIPLPMRVCYK